MDSIEFALQKQPSKEHEVKIEEPTMYNHHHVHL